MVTFLVITIIVMLQAAFGFYYQNLVDSMSVTTFSRYMIELFANAFFDLPLILIMTYYHHKTFKKDNEVQES